MFAIDRDQALLTIILQRLNLFYNLVISQCFTDRIPVGNPETAILAVICAFVPYIERSEKHYPVPVYFFLKLTSPCPDLLKKVSSDRIYQYSSLFKGKPVLVERFGNNLPYPALIRFCIVDKVPYLIRFNEWFHSLIRYAQFFRRKTHLSRI